MPALPPPEARRKGQAGAMTEVVAVMYQAACTLSSAAMSSGIIAEVGTAGPASRDLAPTLICGRLAKPYSKPCDSAST